MSGGGRAIGLGRGRGLIGSVGRPETFREQGGIRRGATEEVGRGEGEGIGDALGRRQFLYPGTSNSVVARKTPLNKRFFALGFDPEERGYNVDMYERPKAPETVHKYDKSGTAAIIPRSLAQLEMGPGRGLRSDLNVAFQSNANKNKHSAKKNPSPEIQKTLSPEIQKTLSPEIQNIPSPAIEKIPTPQIKKIPSLDIAKYPPPIKSATPPTEESSWGSESPPPMDSALTSSTGSGTSSKSVLSKSIIYMAENLLPKTLSNTEVIRLNLEDGKGVFWYYVEFSPYIESLTFRNLAIGELTPVLGKVKMFDKNMLLLPAQLKEKRTELDVTHPSDLSKVVTCIIKFVQRVDIKDCLPFYSQLFNEVMGHLSMVRLGGNFYDSRVLHPFPQHKLEIWHGFGVSVEVIAEGLVLCLDFSFHKIILEETAYDVYVRIRSSGTDDWKKKFEKAILGKIVLTRYNNIFYKVHEVLWKSKPTDPFPPKAGPVTFINHHETKYNLNVNDKNQPLLLSQLKPESSGRYQYAIRKICLIPEFCHMVGPTSEQVENVEMMKDIAPYTQLSLQQRTNVTNKLAKGVQESEKSTSILKDWGLSIASAQVHRRVRTGP